MKSVFLVHTEIATDLKFEEAAEISGQRLGDVMAVWLFVMCSAATVDDGGAYCLKAAALGRKLGCGSSGVAAVLAAFEAQGMIGAGIVTKWRARQADGEPRPPRRETAAAVSRSTLRSRNRRARKRAPDAPELPLSCASGPGDARATDGYDRRRAGDATPDATLDATPATRVDPIVLLSESCLAAADATPDATACNADATLCNGASVASALHPPSPKKELPPTPPIEKTTPTQPSLRSENKSVRATRLRPDWEPNEFGAAFARHELGSDRAAREADKFRDYWLAKAGRDAAKLDWDRTWLNWVRNAADRPGPLARASPNGHTRPIKTNLFLQALIESQQDADRTRYRDF